MGLDTGSVQALAPLLSVGLAIGGLLAFSERYRRIGSVVAAVRF